MAITRSQQAKQMLQLGGRIGLQGGGRDASQADFSSPPGNTGNTGNTGGGSTNREMGIMSRGLGPKGTTGNIGDFSPTGPERDTRLETIRKRNVFVDTFAKNLTPPSFTDRIRGLPNKMRIIGLKNKLNKFANINQIKGPLGLQVVNAFNPGNLTAQDYADIFGSPDLDQLGMTGKDLTNIDNTIDALDKAEKTGITQDEFEKAFYGPDGPPVVDDRGGNVRPPIRYGVPAAAQTADADDSDYYGGKNPFDINRVAYRLMADGGAVIDDEPRQAYGLGSIVKKATRAVKKVAKSPVGKALLAYGAYKLGGLKFGEGDMSLFQRFSELSGPQKALLGIGATSALAGFMTPEQEEEDEEEFRGEGLDIPLYRRNPQGFLAPRFRAEGGSINEEEKEPVAKKVMPLIDMDGMEKDYRETGGFVEMGRMEKADDVPARLSKNEFVFTADAVRNAGDGSVDKGAEVMYNMMKNLEAGGEVSEESQGLEGARKMFQTSQRLEEVL